MPSFLLALRELSINYDFRCLVKERPNGIRRILHSLLVITTFSGMVMGGSASNGLLFAERMFGWTVVDYANFTSYMFVVIALR